MKHVRFENVQASQVFIDEKNWGEDVFFIKKNDKKRERVYCDIVRIREHENHVIETSKYISRLTWGSLSFRPFLLERDEFRILIKKTFASGRK
jgi:hypothetical protein